MVAYKILSAPVPWIGDLGLGDLGLGLDKNGPNITFFWWTKQIFPSILYDVYVS